MTKHTAEHLPILQKLHDLETASGRRSAAEQIASIAEATPLPPTAAPRRTLWRDPSLTRWIGTTPASPRAKAARDNDERLHMVPDLESAHLVSSLCTDGKHRPCWDCDYELTTADLGSGRTLVTFRTKVDADAWQHVQEFLASMDWAEPSPTATILFTVPVNVIESSTPGHFHLYIEAPLSWGAYRELLELCRAANIILGSVVPLSIDRGQTFLLKPGLSKADIRDEQLEMFGECGSLFERLG